MGANAGLSPPNKGIMDSVEYGTHYSLNNEYLSTGHGD